MSKLVMGYWDCPVCGSKEIRGDVVNCPSCGRARGDVKFYLKGYTEGTLLKEEELNQFEQLDEEKAQQMGDKPDWYCSFCNSLNSDKAEVCSTCGASRADSESNYFEMRKKKEEQEAAEAAAQGQVSAAPQKNPRRLMMIAVAIVLAIVGLVIWLNGNKTDGDLKISSMSWTREINIDEYRMYSESGWTLPAGATQTNARREIHHYDQVLDHYENVSVTKSKRVLDHYEYEMKDNGNGTFSSVSHPVYTTEYYTDTERRPVYRSEPRYQTKYYYDIWRWTPSRDVSASGDDHNVYWPEFTLEEKEREGQHTETYRFTVEHIKNTKKGPASYRLRNNSDEEIKWWMDHNVGDQLYITAKRTGASPFVSDKKGNKIIDLVREDK